MKKLIMSILLMSLLLWPLIAAGCTAKAQAFTDSSTEVNVTVNEEFTIALGSNPSTGYSWMVTFDPNTLSLPKSEYKAGDNANGRIVGAPSVQYFTFKASQTGQTKIVFTYKRPWESTPQDQQQTFTVNVK